MSILKGHGTVLLSTVLLSIRPLRLWTTGANHDFDLEPNIIQCVCVHPCMRVYMIVYVHVYVNVYDEYSLYVYLYLYVHVCVCVCLLAVLRPNS